MFAAALAPACGGSSSPSSPDTTPPTSNTPQTSTVTYSGTFQSSNDSYGSITLTAQIPVASLAALASTTGTSQPKAVVSATGTLRPGANTTVPLTGTYDTATNKFTVSGSGFNVTATVTTTADGPVVNGTVTTSSTTGAVVALPPPATGTVITYCGNYTGGSTGTIVVTRRDNKLVALVAEKGEPAPYSINGTLNGTTVNLSFTWAPPDVGSTTVTGSLNGGVMSGTWSDTDHESGEWIVRAGSCPLS